MPRRLITRFAVAVVAAALAAPASVRAQADEPEPSPPPRAPGQQGPREAPAKDEPAEDEPAEDEPTEDEPAEDEPTEDEPAEDEPTEGEPAEDEPTEGEPAEEDERAQDPSPATEGSEPRTPAAAGSETEPRAAEGQGAGPRPAPGAEADAGPEPAGEQAPQPSTTRDEPPDTTTGDDPGAPMGPGQTAAPTSAPSAPAAGPDPATADLGAPEPQGEGAADALPWAGSRFILDQQVTANTFLRDAQLSYDPTYITNFTLRPVYRIDDKTSVQLTQSLAVEWTDSNFTNSPREPFLSDLTLDLSRTRLVEFHGFSLGGLFRLQFPVSKTSRAATELFATGIRATVSRTFERVLQGLSPSVSLGYTHRFTRDNVGQGEFSRPCRRIGEDAAVECNDLGGASNVADQFVVGFGLSLGVWDTLRVGTSFALTYGLALGLSEATVVTDDGSVVQLPATDREFRDATAFGLSASYAPINWLNFVLAMTTSSSQLDPDGTRRNPFFNNDTVFSLSTVFTLDKPERELVPGKPSDEP